MTNDFTQFAQEISSAPSQEVVAEIVEAWEGSHTIIRKAPQASPPHLTYTDAGVNINIPSMCAMELDFSSDEFSAQNLATMASVWAEAYKYALATQPTRDRAKEVRDAIKQAGPTPTLDDTEATSLVEELNRLGYEIIKKNA